MKNRYYSTGIVLLVCVLLVVGVLSAVEAQSDNGVSVENSNDVVRIMGDIHIPEDQTIEGDVVSILGNIKVEGPVQGDVVAILGDIDLNNEVQGDVVTILGQLTKGDLARIQGKTSQVSIGSMNFNGIFPGLSLSGLSNLRFAFSRSFSLVQLLILFGLALLVFSLMPEKQKSMAQGIEQSLGRRLLIGLVGVMVLPIIMFILAISILGIPLIPFIFLGFILINFIGYVAVVFYTGQRISAVGQNEINIYLKIFLGVLILWVLNSLPFLGWIFHMLIMFLALGTVIDTKFGTNRPWFKKKEAASSSNEVTQETEENIVEEKKEIEELDSETEDNRE